MKKEFLQAVVSKCVQLGGGVKEIRGRTASRGAVSEQLDSLRKADPGLRVVLQEFEFAVVDTADRARSISKKTDASIMIMHGIKSLDDAIDLVGGSIEDSCLAAYHFGNPATGNYLAQFIASEASYVNHILRELLVGPAIASDYGLVAKDRYPPTLFSVRRPAFITPSANSSALASALSGQSAQSLLVEATKPLAEFKSILVEA